MPVVTSLGMVSFSRPKFWLEVKGILPKANDTVPQLAEEAQMGILNIIVWFCEKVAIYCVAVFFFAETFR